MSLGTYRCLSKLYQLSSRNQSFKIFSLPQKSWLSTSIEQSEVSLNYSKGLVTIVLPLIAKQEKCLFTLKPISDTVGNFIDYLKNEDRAIEKATLFTLDGLKISNNTQIGVLVRDPFKLQINEKIYILNPPKDLTSLNQQIIDNHKNDIDDIRVLVSKLYVDLNVEEHLQTKEQNIVQEIEKLKTELEPLEKTKEMLAQKAKTHTNRMIWVGLAAMGVQTGILARLTWFEYSWDIVEPISYFVTYTSVIGVYAYFVLTRKEYDYESASDRIFLRNFHKNAQKSNMDISKYNRLKDTIHKLENDLNRIKENEIKILKHSNEKQVN